VRHIGVFMNLPEGDPDGTRRIAALLKSLDEFGWTEGRNIRFDFRWGVDADRVQQNAEALVALNPDVIVAASLPAVLALQQTTRKVPIIFVGVTDPVALGLVESLARPGGNATGFSPAEVELSAKWVQVLKEMAPALTRVAVFHNPAYLGGVPQFSAVQTAAASLGVALSTIDVRDNSVIEQADCWRCAYLRMSHCVIRLWRSQPSTGCRRSTRCGCSPPVAAWRPMGPTLSRSTARLPAMSIGC
jgi:putative ABC transport system substrate-binding protein